MRVSLEGWRAALWGDLNAGVAALAAEVTRLSMLGREQDEPLGSVLLGRARAILLTKAGAFGAATQVAEGLPERIRVLSLARIHVWSGQYRLAVRLADGGPYQPDLDSSERARFTTIRAGAALLGWIAGEMVATDPIVMQWLSGASGWVLPSATDPSGLQPTAALHYGAATLGAALVVGLGFMLARNAERTAEKTT